MRDTFGCTAYISCTDHVQFIPPVTALVDIMPGYHMCPLSYVSPTICVPVISFDECRYIRVLLSISNLEVDEFYSLFSLLCVSIFAKLNDAKEDDEDEDEDVDAGEVIILLMIMMLTMMDFRSYLS